MKKYDYLIVGCGLFGAVFAHEAKQKGKSVLIIEKRDHIGGNIYCAEEEGILVHKYGAHIFHTSNKAVWNYVNQFVEFNNFVNSPIANYKGEIYNMPFNMNTFSKMFGVATPKEAERVIEEQRAEIKGEPKNLEEQAVSLVGREIYTKLIKGYTEKQWGRDCKDLPAFIIKRLPVRYTYNNNYFNDRYQGIPIEGYTVLIERLIEGCDVRLNTDFFATVKCSWALPTNAFTPARLTAISIIFTESSVTEACALKTKCLTSRIIRVSLSSTIRSVKFRIPVSLSTNILLLVRNRKPLSQKNTRLTGKRAWSLITPLTTKKTTHCMPVMSNALRKSQT